MQLGLTIEEKQQLEGVSLMQLLAAFRAESFKFSTGSSAYRGVVFHKRKQKYGAAIKVASKRIHIGYFTEEEDAARAYDTAAIKHIGR